MQTLIRLPLEYSADPDQTATLGANLSLFWIASPDLLFVCKLFKRPLSSMDSNVSFQNTDKFNFKSSEAKDRNDMSRVVRKPAFCICENKDADQLRGNREADQRLCFRYTDSTIPLLPKSKISSL